MVVKASTQEIRLVPSMVQGTVMLNAHMILNSLMVKVIAKTGNHQQPIQIPVLVKWEVVAQKWIFGKPTRFQKLTPHIHVQ